MQQWPTTGRAVELTPSRCGILVFHTWCNSVPASTGWTQDAPIVICLHFPSMLQGTQGGSVVRNFHFANVVLKRSQGQHQYDSVGIGSAVVKYGGANWRVNNAVDKA